MIFISKRVINHSRAEITEGTPMPPIQWIRTLSREDVNIPALIPANGVFGEKSPVAPAFGGAEMKRRPRGPKRGNAKPCEYEGFT
jgi:hypothetical protein